MIGATISSGRSRLDGGDDGSELSLSLSLSPPNGPVHRPGAAWGKRREKEVPPVRRPGRDSTHMLFDPWGKENNINGNSPSTTLTGMNRVPASPSEWTRIDRRNPLINLALIDFFFLSSSQNKSGILSRGGESSKFCKCLGMWRHGFIYLGKKEQCQTWRCRWVSTQPYSARTEVLREGLVSHEAASMFSPYQTDSWRH